jgi:hypothetical protein
MMFEAAELGRTIPKEEYKPRIPTLRTELLESQQQLTNARFPVIVVFAGVDGAGKCRFDSGRPAWSFWTIARIKMCVKSIVNSGTHVVLEGQIRYR